MRYTSGTLPTDLGFTGQYSDASTTGLDYYNARYFDPTLGQFASADTTLLGGLNRYAYVGGNPTSRTDPSGHCEGGDEPDCPVAPEARDPLHDFESTTHEGCTANCDEVPFGAEISYDEMANYEGNFEAGNANPAIEYESEAERIHIEKVEQAESQAQQQATQDATTNTTTTATTPEGTTSDATGPGNGGNDGQGSAQGNGGSSPVAGSASSGPDFIVTQGGDVIPVPEGATGPAPTGMDPGNPTGIKYTGGQGGNGLAPSVTGVRIMNPTEPDGQSPGYPGGYVSYFKELPNGFEQPVRPYDGARIRGYGGFWRHISIDLIGN